MEVAKLNANIDISGRDNLAVFIGIERIDPEHRWCFHGAEKNTGKENQDKMPDMYKELMLRAIDMYNVHHPQHQIMFNQFGDPYIKGWE